MSRIPTETELKVLATLSKQRCGMYALQISRVSQYEVEPESVYVFLRRLKIRGLVTSVVPRTLLKGHSKPRPIYTLTTAGDVALYLCRQWSPPG